MLCEFAPSVAETVLVGVLILVIVEYALWVDAKDLNEVWSKDVLILVIVEYALWDKLMKL